MDAAMRPPLCHSRMGCRRIAASVAGRARGSNPVLAHDCVATRLCARASREVLQSLHAAFSRHPHRLPPRSGRAQCAALSDREYGDRAVHLALSLRAVFAVAGDGWPALETIADTQVSWPLSESH